MSLITSLKRNNTFRYLAVVVALSMLLVTGCNKVPDGMSKEIYELGVEASNIAQQYIDGKVTSASAYQTLSELYEKSEDIIGKNEYEEKRNGVENDYWLDILISADIAYIAYFVLEEDDVKVINELEDLNKELKPDTTSNETLTDIIRGDWKFTYEDSETIAFLTFDYVDCTAEFYYEDGESDKFSFEYEIDEENMDIIEIFEDGTKRKWANISEFTETTMTYKIYGGKVATGIKLD